MSDGREERKEQEERRKWEEERKDPDRHQGDRERDWERDGERERRDSRTVEVDARVRAESTRRTRRSFLVAAAAAAGGYGFYRWIDRSPGDQLIQRPLRKMLDFNAKVARGVFNERGLAPTYPVSKSMELRTNGNSGLKMDMVPESYRLQMVGVENAKRFPRYVDDVTAGEYRYAAKKEPGPVEHDTKVAPKDEAKIERMYRLAYGRAAEADEISLGLRFLSEASKADAGKQTGLHLSAWEQYAQVLLLGNEFAFVD